MRSFTFVSVLLIVPAVFAANSKRQAAPLPAHSVRRRTNEDSVLSCIEASTSGTGCAPTDSACLCKSSVFITQAAACFQSSCDAADANAGIAFGEAYCLSGGIKVSIPAGVATTIVASSSSKAPAPAPAPTTSSKAAAPPASSSPAAPASSSAPAPAPATTSYAATSSSYYSSPAYSSSTDSSYTTGSTIADNSTISTTSSMPSISPIIAANSTTTAATSLQPAATTKSAGASNLQVSIALTLFIAGGAFYLF